MTTTAPFRPRPEAVALAQAALALPLDEREALAGEALDLADTNGPLAPVWRATARFLTAVASTDEARLLHEAAGGRIDPTVIAIGLSGQTRRLTLEASRMGPAVRLELAAALAALSARVMGLEGAQEPRGRFWAALAGVVRAADGTTVG